MLPITIESDGVLERVGENMESAPEWMPDQIELALDVLGRTVAAHMQLQLEAHRYQGDLINSVKYEYDAGKQEVRIGPTLKRGQYDAGLIHELGVKAIPRAPWKPIAEWAEARGIPAGPVWKSIREHGVKPHPFLDATLQRSAGALGDAAETLGTLVAERIVDTT